MDKLTADSPAKLNLTLRVVGRRPDGFHEIESFVARISLCDRLQVSPREDARITLACDNPAVPADDSNLVLRAARALAAARGVRDGAHIALTKRIPMGAGLGGGSSNAATTLVLLNDLWRLGRSRDELAHIGAALGCDVPLFLFGPRCVIRGRGEQVEEVAATNTYWAALVLPELHCATPAVYVAWDRLTTRPARPTLAQVLAAQGTAGEMMEVLFNDLEESAFAVAPALRDLAERIAERCGRPVRLTGSGAALFRLFDDAQSAARFALSIGVECSVRADVVALHARPTA